MCSHSKTEKQCSNCKEVLPVSEFCKRAASKDGRAFECKSCCAQYRLENAEKIRQLGVKYRSNNSETIRQKKSEYRKKNSEVISAKAAERYKANRRHHNQMCREYRVKNLDSLRQRDREKYQENTKEIKQRVRAYARNNPAKVALGRMRRLDTSCNLTVQDVQNLFDITLFCPVLGIPIIRGEGRLHDGSPSIDRLDSSIGYEFGNVWLISHKANRMKNNASFHELKSFSNFWGMSL